MLSKKLLVNYITALKVYEKSTIVTEHHEEYYIIIMDLKNKKILITGADGFIGSHLTEELIKSGCNVRAFILYNSFNSWGWLDHSEIDIKKSIEIFVGDIRDPLYR